MSASTGVEGRSVMMALSAVSAFFAVVAFAERDVSLSGEGWRFAKEAGESLRAESESFDDSDWKSVRVPHDWVISESFDRNLGGGTGKLPWRGVAWYRRVFELRPEEAGGRVFLDFDGVMAAPRVYVNGRLAGEWNYGYESKCLDVTPFVRFGDTNVLVVRTDTTRMKSRWYPGGGIYRKVVMKVRNAAHFADKGIFVTTPAVSLEKAIVNVNWELEGPVREDARVTVSVCDPSGRVVAQEETAAGIGCLRLQLCQPKLWDVESPNLHVARVELKDAAGNRVSSECVRFGIRTISFPTPTDEPEKSDRAANGFHLNGRRVQLKGVNLHSDLGLLGMAFDKSAMRRQLQLMKDMGANAVRTSHNCPAPEMLDLCDEMGIVVWDECFDKWDRTSGRTDECLEGYIAPILRNFVRRDRNHPSVIVWSMSNEIGYTGHKWTSGGGLTRARCSYFRNVMRAEDSTRPIGNGNIEFMRQVLDEGTFDDLDITGWNYGASYREMHKRLPGKPVVYSESASAYSSYGFYEEALPTGKTHYAHGAWQTSGYDMTAAQDIADVEFDRMEKDVYCCGEFVWTGIDYLGEPSPYDTASRSSYFGIVDLTGTPKDRYWLYRSQWNDKEETVHIVPHWNWSGREGKPVPVFVYTSGDSAELLVNGKSQGVRAKGSIPAALTNGYYAACSKYRLMWLDVPYEPGELKAVAYRGNRKIGEAVVLTAERPVSLRVQVEAKRTSDADELLWVRVNAVDAKGVADPRASNRVSFKLDGPGRILGVGNGNAHAFESFAKTDSHEMFNGNVVAVIRRDGDGELRLTVSSECLKSAEVPLP